MPEFSGKDGLPSAGRASQVPAPDHDRKLLAPGKDPGFWDRRRLMGEAADGRRRMPDHPGVVNSRGRACRSADGRGPATQGTSGSEGHRT